MRILYLPNCWSQQRQKEKARWIYPVLLAMQAQYHRNLGHQVYWDDGRVLKVLMDKVITEPEDINFLNLPAPDRVFTNAFDKRYQENGNFKFHPGTYIQVADGCWWGKCSFCVERERAWKVRDIWSVHQELKEIKHLGFREVFDDSGTFPVGEWLNEFLRLPPLGLTLGCNMRMVDVDYARMKRFGFRMVLFGVESANQRTLDLINKGTKTSDIKHIISASKAGLDCHGAFMFGYPWEIEKDEFNTLHLAHELLRKGILKTAQASFYNPIKGLKMSDEGKRKFVRKLYDVAWSPEFWMNKLKSIKNTADLKYFFRQIKAGILG